MPCRPHQFVVNPLTTAVAPTPAYHPLLFATPPVLPSVATFPEFHDAPASVVEQIFTVDALVRSTLHMLAMAPMPWSFEEFLPALQTHKHSRGMTVLSLPNTIDECAVRMASKLQKTLHGHANTILLLNVFRAPALILPSWSKGAPILSTLTTWSATMVRLDTC